MIDLLAPFLWFTKLQLWKKAVN